MKRNELVALIEEIVRKILNESHSDSKETYLKDLFDNFWKTYPRKVGKAEAKKVWRKLKPSKALFAEIIKAIQKQNQTVWHDMDKQYIPHASRWLRNERWLDEIPEPEQKDDIHSPRMPTNEEIRLIMDDE